MRYLSGHRFCDISPPCRFGYQCCQERRPRCTPDPDFDKHLLFSGFSRVHQLEKVAAFVPDNDDIMFFDGIIDPRVIPHRVDMPPDGTIDSRVMSHCLADSGPELGLHDETCNVLLPDHVRMDLGQAVFVLFTPAVYAVEPTALNSPYHHRPAECSLRDIGNPSQDLHTLSVPVVGED
jgi:hypothetical protein